VEGSRTYPEFRGGLGERVDVTEFPIVVGRFPFSRWAVLCSMAVVVGRRLARYADKTMALQDGHRSDRLFLWIFHAASLFLELLEFAAIFLTTISQVTTGLSEMIAS